MGARSVFLPRNSNVMAVALTQASMQRPTKELWLPWNPFLCWHLNPSLLSLCMCTPGTGFPSVRSPLLFTPHTHMCPAVLFWMPFCTVGPYCLVFLKFISFFIPIFKILFSMIGLGDWDNSTDASPFLWFVYYILQKWRKFTLLTAYP